METVELKLKQASAVLEANPKDIQNLVQFGVLRPKRRAGQFLFDTKTLYTAQFALCMRQNFGTKTEHLSLFTEAFSARIDELLKRMPEFIVLCSRSPYETYAIELKVPFRKIAEEIEGRLEQVPLFRDLPRGRKRPGWKTEFRESLKEAARELGAVSDERVLKAIQEYRKTKKRKPEITIVVDTQAASTQSSG